MKAWQKLTTAGLTVSIVITLTACGTNQSSTPAPDKGTSGEKVKLIYARGQDATGATKKLVDEFMKTHPNIEVDFREMPS
ncbi:MAG: ABC transporter substrate-binding protein, partial [Tumebacillaceae bacterium]